LKASYMADKKEKGEKKDDKNVRANSKKENPEQKRKIEAELDEDSSSEEGIPATRAGYIEMKGKKKWKAVYCMLVGGTLFFYTNSSEPKGKIDLKGHKLENPSKSETKKKNAFSVVNESDEPAFTGSCSASTELDLWVKALESSLDKEASEPPTALNSTSKKKAGLMSRAKKRAASKTATSALGKKVMKAIVNDETSTLLNALKHIVKAESGSQKKADDLEKNIIKIAVKAFLLIENKLLTADDFLVADKPLREAFEIMVKVFNGRGRVKQDKITEALQKVENLLKKAEEVITNLMAPHMTAKNMLRISAAFGCIADVKFLSTVFADDTLEGDLDKLVDAMEYYTQFHYH